MCAVFGQAAPIDGGEITLNPPWGGEDSPMDGGDSPRVSPVEIWSGVKCLLKECAPPQNWGRMATLKAVELALCKIGDSLGELSGHEAAGKVGGCFSWH